MHLLVIPTIQMAVVPFNCEVLQQMWERGSGEVAQVVTAATSAGGITEEVVIQETFECWGANHFIAIAVSLVTAAPVICLVVVQTLLYQDISIRGTIPWRQPANRIELLKLCQKFITCFF